MARRNHAQDEPVRADLAALPGQLEQIDAWIAEGLLGGEEPNAADLQIGSTIRLLRDDRRRAPADRRPPGGGPHALLPADGRAQYRGDAAGGVAAGKPAAA